MLKTSLHDQKNGNTLAIEGDGAASVYVIPRPPIGEREQALPFTEALTLNGLGVTSSMLVNGSVTNQDFYVSAKPYDVYVNTVSFIIADAGANLRSFGALTALTNGLEFYYFSQENGLYSIDSGLKTNLDFVRLANFEPAFGTGTEAFQGRDIIGASEGYVGIIDLEDVFGLQWGLKLRANSTDRIGFIVKDNITGIDLMNIKVFGIRI